MIFVTVGTHEQGMDRLFKEIDRLIDEGIITDEVIAQIGYTEYMPRNYKCKKMISYDDMDKYMRKADIVITHGGPGSIFHALQYAKIPIVIPRNPKFNEHVDEHQILFSKRLEYDKKIISIYNIEDLKTVINNYSMLVNNYKLNLKSNTDFIEKFKNLINEEFLLK